MGGELTAAASVGGRGLVVGVLLCRSASAYIYTRTQCTRGVQGGASEDKTSQASGGGEGEREREHATVGRRARRSL